MAGKSKETEQEYQRKYYEEHIKNNDEAREKKNARQREYAKRTGYAADIKSKKNNTKRYVLQVTISTELDIIQKLDLEKNKDGYATYIKKLIRADIKSKNDDL